MLRLSTFILNNLEPILQEWENFAKTLFPETQQTTTGELRDHAKKMLLLIADDLDRTQSKSEQTKKSKGLKLETNTKETPASEHGLARMLQGFSINQMVSEFRALRASVTKLFGKEPHGIQENNLNDLIRFNEAIDQALAESVLEYALSKERQTLLFEGMLSSSPVLSYILDLEGSFVYVNQAMVDLYKKPAYELLGKAIYNFKMPSIPDMREHIQTIIDTGKQLRGEMSFKDTDHPEKICFYEYVLAPIFDTHGAINAIAGTSRNITEQKIAEKQVWINANYDLLTGLPNRLMFREKLEQALKHSKRTGKPFSLFFIDLDKFKRVNDTLGHEMGDLLLKQVAVRISTNIREMDVVARMGGDELTVILPDIDNAEQSKMIAEKLLTELQKPFKLKQTTYHASASIGITLSPQDSTKPDVLMKNADLAMYAAKKSGGNQFSLYTKPKE